MNIATKLSERIEYYEYLLSEIAARFNSFENDVLQAYETIFVSNEKLSKEFLEVSNKLQVADDQIEHLLIEKRKLTERSLQFEKSRDQMKQLLDDNQRFVELERSVSNMYAFIMRKQEIDEDIIEPIAITEGKIYMTFK